MLTANFAFSQSLHSVTVSEAGESDPQTPSGKTSNLWFLGDCLVLGIGNVRIATTVEPSRVPVDLEIKMKTGLWSSWWNSLMSDTQEKIIASLVSTPIALALIWVFGVGWFINVNVPHVPLGADIWSGLQIGGIPSVIQTVAFFVLAFAGTALGFMIGEGMLHTALTDRGVVASSVQLLGSLAILPLTVMMVVLYTVSMSEGILIGPFLGAVAVGVVRIIRACYASGSGVSTGNFRR